MPSCDLFAPTKEQYAEVVAERDKLRALAKVVDAYFEKWRAEADKPITDALRALDTNDGVWWGKPYWMRP